MERSTMTAPTIAPVPAGYQIRLPDGSFKAFLIAFILFVFIPGFGRVVFRLYLSRKLFLDDWIVLFAVICLGPAAAVTHSIQNQIFLQISVGVGWEPPPPNFYQDMLVFEQRILIASVLVWTALYAIKFAFLIFFRKLVSRVEKLMILWWVVFGLTVVCGLVSIPLGFVVCSHLTPDYMSYCPVPKQLANERSYLIATTTMDVVTDVLILIIPMLMLWPLQVALRRKLALMGMMSLSVFMIAIAIIRCAGAPLPNGVIDTSWLIFWQGMESAVAVLMVSLLVLKSMFAVECERRKTLQHRLDAEKGLSYLSSESPSSTFRKSWRDSFRRNPHHSVDHEQVQIYTWNPIETFAIPQVHRKPPSTRGFTRNYSRPSYHEVHTEVMEVPPTSPPQRYPTPADEICSPTFYRDSRSSSSSEVTANRVLMSRYFPDKTFGYEGRRIISK